MIKITEALPNEFNIIQDIAYETWPLTYGNILPKPHMVFMLESFYSIESLNKNVIDGHHFLLAKEREMALGFASYIHNYPTPGTTKIPKIYIRPETQGKGIGKLLIGKIATEAGKFGNEILTLNVNRQNKARHFYEKLGFVVKAEEDIDLGNGVVQEDFIMEKQL